MKKYKRNYTLILEHKGKKVKLVETTHKKRFLTHMRLINWNIPYSRIYLKVYYGKKIDAFGKLTQFFNYGWYNSEKDLTEAFEAFDEED